MNMKPYRERYRDHCHPIYIYISYNFVVLHANHNYNCKSWLHLLQLSSKLFHAQPCKRLDQQQSSFSFRTRTPPLLAVLFARETHSSPEVRIPNSKWSAICQKQQHLRSSEHQPQVTVAKERFHLIIVNVLRPAHKEPHTFVFMQIYPRKEMSKTASPL